MSIVGLGFFSASLLMFLLTVTDAITASAIMGGGYLGLGLIFMVAARGTTSETTQTSSQKVPEAPDTRDMPPLAAAFMHGMAQGMAEGRRH